MVWKLTMFKLLLQAENTLISLLRSLVAISFNPWNKNRTNKFHFDWNYVCFWTETNVRVKKCMQNSAKTRHGNFSCINKSISVCDCECIDFCVVHTEIVEKLVWKCKRRFVFIALRICQQHKFYFPIRLCEISVELMCAAGNDLLGLKTSGNL